MLVLLLTDPIGRAVESVGLWPLACWNCGFKSRRRRGCLSLVIVVCCHVEGLCRGLCIELLTRFQEPYQVWCAQQIIYSSRLYITTTVLRERL